MPKRRTLKTDWKQYVFVPRGADREAHGIKFGDDGYLHLCGRFNNGESMADYDIYSTDLRPELRGTNVAIDWTGFREAMAKHRREHPQAASVFTGRYQHSPEGHDTRRRMLHAICREYQHPEALADDLWDFVRRGKSDEAENLIRILAIYFRDPSQRPESRPSWPRTQG
jgi:hypothetical protein